MERFVFDNKREFLSKLKQLLESGVPPGRINTFTPFHVHETEALLNPKQSHVRFFAGVGGFSGFVAGFAFTIYTVKSWPLITSGKPLISIPPFMIIAYELTILIGSLVSFLGFLLLSRLPAVRNVFSPKEEFTNKFEIRVEGDRRP